MSSNAFGSYLTNAYSEVYYGIFHDVVKLLKTKRKPPTMKAFEKLGNYINDHMDDAGWWKLIANAKFLVKVCRDIMKTEGSFQSFRFIFSTWFDSLLP